MLSAILAAIWLCIFTIECAGGGDGGMTMASIPLLFLIGLAIHAVA